MSERLVIMAVTKMLSGMCTAGVSVNNGAWIRPVKEFGTLLLGDLSYKDKTVMRPFDVVDLSLIKPRPRPPHKEDWTCDFVRTRPVLIRSLDSAERLVFLQKHSEPQAPEQVMRAERSLALFEPSDLEIIINLDCYSQRYETRLRTPEMGERTIPITDIKWRALGRKLLSGSGQLTLDMDAIKTRLKCERVFVALGLGRMHEGRHWPLVIGIHTWPDYSIDIDYRNL